ncbi:cell division protein FtsX [Lyngbya confervoides]|uniref:Cell division protein FtsX n=1 Tax=Lyngbya confervoides BDU141951 TaxID=1574623 RepID=A0ABD4T3C2_9CYAN|nr:ABC transporter permease [Lyngbya confervoides]MCM1983131.1 ABC transporter permease [Lyngbya confervoides BDU141951]
MRSARLAPPDTLQTWMTKLRYLSQETWRSLRRGGWMNWAAISTVTVLLFLFGLSLQTSWQVNGLLGQMGSQLEISVFMKPDMAGSRLQAKILQFPEIAAVQVVSKDEAWKDLLADMGTTDIAGATAGLGGNPLVDELKVRATSPGEVAGLVKKLASFSEVDEVTYLDEALAHLSQISRGFSRVSVILVGLLTLTAIAVINTTIRLIVVARQQEIEVMQLVGATTNWIYLPFLLQGITFGLIGAAMSGLLMAGSRSVVQRALANQPNFLQTLSDGLSLTPAQALLLPLVMLTFGSLIGFLGSLFAVRRFVLR